MTAHGTHATGRRKVNKTLWQYYVDTAAEITDRALEGIASLEEWQRQRRPKFGRGVRTPAMQVGPTDRELRSRDVFASAARLPFPELCCSA